MSGLAAHRTPIGPANDLATTTTSVNVSNAVAPGVGQIFRTTSATTGTWQDLYQGYVNPCDPEYGADRTGATDSTAAFLAAIATGYSVAVPPGTYLLSDTLTLSTQGQRMVSMIPSFGLTPYAVTFNFASLTKNFIVLSGIATGVAGFVVTRPTGYTNPTAGIDITIGVSSGTTPYSISVAHVHLLYSYVGIKTLRHQNANVHHYSCTYPRYCAFWMHSQVPYGGGSYRDFSIGGDSTAPYGILIDQADFNQWEQIVIGGTGFTDSYICLNSSSGAVTNQQFVNLYLDGMQAGKYAIKLTKGAYENISHQFTNIQTNTSSYASSHGVYVGSGVEQTSFNHYKCISVAGGRAFSIYGDGTTLTDIKVGTTTYGSTTGEGIHIYSGADNTTISGGSRIRNHKYAVVVDAGSTDTTIVGNNFKDNNTSAVSLGTGVRATLTMESNAGVDDWITSISATPEKVGQTALVAGVWYKAIATSSTADWKALN